MSLTYPNERWPTDAAIEALDGTTDQNTGLPYIAKGTGPHSQPTYEVQYNRAEQRLRQILGSWRQGMVVDEGDLKIGAYPMHYTLGGSRRFFSGASGVSVPDDSLRVLYLDNTATLQLAEAWPADLTTFLPLAGVSTANGQMTLTDYRVQTVFHVPPDGVAESDRRIVTAHRGSIGSGQSAVEIFEFDPPSAMTLEEVQIYCSAVVGAASIDVREAGTSVLVAAPAPQANTVVKPTLSDQDISADNSVTVHATTDGGGSIQNLTVTLIFRAN